MAQRRTIALALLGLALIASATLLAYWGRGQIVGADELHYASRLSTQSLGHAMFHPPSGGYLITVPMLVYKALLETAGLGSYAPHRAVAIALALTCAILFFALARRRVGDLWALPPTVLMLSSASGRKASSPRIGSRVRWLWRQAWGRSSPWPGRRCGVTSLPHCC